MKQRRRFRRLFQFKRLFQSRVQSRLQSWFQNGLRVAFGIVCLTVLIATLSGMGAIAPLRAQAPESQSPVAQPNETLPALQTHPLPLSLAQWHDDSAQGDYFDAVQPTNVGYLVWSHFPVSVYVEPPTEPPTGAGDRSQEWFDAVQRAIQEWTTYLPLTVVSTPDRADITFWRRAPRIEGFSAPNFRARAAETEYQLYIQRSAQAPATLSHRFTIVIRPRQPIYVEASARHELGHALGIWGHSPTATDALYFSQVRTPPPISVRDINTLRRVYEQPTRLGWAVE